MCHRQVFTVHSSNSACFVRAVVLQRHVALGAGRIPRATVIANIAVALLILSSCTQNPHMVACTGTLMLTHCQTVCVASNPKNDHPNV